MNLLIKTKLRNLAKAQEDGYALKLEWEDLSESKLHEMIQTLLNEPR
jgi:hypothetical protein